MFQTNSSYAFSSNGQTNDSIPEWVIEPIKRANAIYFSQVSEIEKRDRIIEEQWGVIEQQQTVILIGEQKYLELSNAYTISLGIIKEKDFIIAKERTVKWLVAGVAVVVTGYTVFKKK